MRDVSPVVKEILSGPFEQRLIVDVLYGDVVTFHDLPIDDWTLDSDLDSVLKDKADLDVVYTGLDGTGLSPRRFADTLAPYGTQVNVLLEVAVKGFSGTVQLGRYRINEVPEMADSFFRFSGQTLVTGSRVKLTCDGLLSAVQRDGLRWPSPPIRSGSCWLEMQRLTGLPLRRTLPDRATPIGLVYDTSDGGRLTAVQQLASHLGGIATVNSYGQLTVVPFGTPTTPVVTLTQAEVLDPPAAVSTDALPNWVAGTYQEDDGTPIYAEAYVSSGPLNAFGPYGRHTYRDTSDTIRTQVDADQRVKDVLARLLEQQTYQVTVDCRLDPRLEVGDVARAVRANDEELIGRVVSVQFGKGATMPVVLDVARDVPAA